MTNNNIELHLGDNLKILKKINSNSIDLIYIDPPFNTGKIQSRTRIKTTKSEDGDRIGFKGQSYKTEVIGKQSYPDIFDDYIEFLKLRLLEAKRILKPQGSFFFTP